MATYDPNTRIWKCPPVQSIFNRDGNLGQAILFVQDLNPDGVCQISADTGIEVTNRQMRQRTLSLAENLRAEGYKLGDVLAIAAKNSEHVAPVVFASLLLGTPLSCLDPGFIKMDYEHILSQTCPKLIFCDPENFKVLRECSNDLGLDAKFVTFMKRVDGAKYIEEYFVGYEKQVNFESPCVKDRSQLISGIVCSSGTTGLSKPIALSHGCHLAFPRRKRSDNRDVYLNFSSMYWLSGYGFLIHLTLLGAKRIITTEPYTPAVVIRIIQKFKVNHYVSSPTRSMELVQSTEVDEADLSSVRILVNLGSILTPELRQKLMKVFKNPLIMNMYGSTESCGAVTAGVADDRLGFVGKVMPGVEIKIVNDQGEALSNGERGEVVIRKKESFLGYYKNPEATAEVKDKEGWIRMGDMGYFNDVGDLFIVDRIKSVMLYRNYWVAPAELEAFIAKLDGVSNVCVGPVPDPVAVDLPAALVVKLPGAAVTITEADITKAVESTFAKHKHLHGGVYFIDEIPVTPSGKVRRDVVRTMLKELYEKRL